AAALLKASDGSALRALADEDEFAAADESGIEAPFTQRVAHLATQAAAVVEAAGHRARSRAAAGRPAFSTETIQALRASRDAIDALLPGEPGAGAVPPGEPAPVNAGAKPLPSKPVAPRHVSQEEFLAILTGR
ncbi:MAG TPA: hypothetical protein VFR93_02175, partial [Candidatus Limnocylindrales bacterium]|nr:hypothetical protein [Candidatus Limnocylindrales bacterium]